MKAMLNSKVAAIELYFAIGKIFKLLNNERLRLPALKFFFKLLQRACPDRLELIRLANVEKPFLAIRQ
jgi:hypothetical protein